jgi:two-component system nitrogen regulation response regulator NtrX
MAIRILIVDDEPRIRSSLKGLLQDEGYRTWECGSGEEALRFLKTSSPDVIMLDVVLPGMDGLEVLKRIRKQESGIHVLMMSGKADLSTAVQATRMGAWDFFEKPLNPDRVLLVLRNIAETVTMENRMRSLESRIGGEEEMVGESGVMKELKEAISRAAPSQGRVMIFGENGTGKELVARAIHRRSSRKDGPFVSLNCAALPEHLVESELFGYEKGAFTGALRRKRGRIETADGGTLFLDEVGDMGLDTQAKLLRVLEENEAVRLGGETPYPFDVRIISATNKDLSKEIEQGRFREDLFYRLNVIPFYVPPLRERKEDIPLLAQHFLSLFTQQTGGGRRTWSSGALEAQKAYAWPGNVRELKNFVERVMIMSRESEISGEDVNRYLSVSGSEPAGRHCSDEKELPLRQRIEQFEREIIQQTFREVEGNISRLARRLGMDRANLYRKLKAYGIK